VVSRGTTAHSEAAGALAAWEDSRRVDALTQDTVTHNQIPPQWYAGQFHRRVIELRSLMAIHHETAIFADKSVTIHKTCGPAPHSVGYVLT